MIIDAEDLALLQRSFAAAMDGGLSGVALDAALGELGWIELLHESPHQAAGMAFELLGSTVSVGSLLDDVLLDALGLAPSSDTCVVLPEPHRADPPGTVDGGFLHVSGLVSSRVDAAARALVAIGSVDAGEAMCLARVDGEVLRAHMAIAVRNGGLDPAVAYRRIGLDSVPFTKVRAVEPDTWGRAVRHARGALAAELIGLSRWMLELARLHAIDRVQFGKPIASFQLVRARLAESLVAIEGAAAVAACLGESEDPLVAATAKSLAGKAARVTAANAQQVLAGIGFTTDHPFHLAMKRALVLDTLFGSAKTLPVDIGRELLARGTAPRLVEL